MLVPIFTNQLKFFGLFLFLGFFLAMAPYLLYLFMKHSRVIDIEEQFPNFLRDLAESKRSGMTLPLAVQKCANTDYGPLSREVKKMSDQISWGISFEEVFTRFAAQTGSRFIQRSISIVVEAQRSGGAISDVLQSVAEDAAMIKESDAQRRSTLSQYVMTVYAIYFIFIGILTSLDRIMVPLASSPTLGMMGGGASLFGGSAAAPASGGFDFDEYKILFFHMAILQGIFNGLLAGQIGEGTIVAGFKHAFIFLVTGFILFLVIMYKFKVECMFVLSVTAFKALGCGTA
jgi:archaeal flagellar protein FlaJ